MEEKAGTNVPTHQSFAKSPANVSCAYDKRIQMSPKLHTWPGHEIREGVDLGTSMTGKMPNAVKYYYEMGIRKLKKGQIDPENHGGPSEIALLLIQGVLQEYNHSFF